MATCVKSGLQHISDLVGVLEPA